jgi:hypothetical protein
MVLLLGFSQRSGAAEEEKGDKERGYEKWSSTRPRPSETF